jgi:predicted transcriptional regulator
MSEVNVHVGYDKGALKDRVLSSIARAEAGDTSSESHITFESWDGLAQALSKQRLALLRRVHLQQRMLTIAALARGLGRDYKRVYEDVSILEQAGLIRRQKGGLLEAVFDEIKTAIDLRQSVA